MATSERPTETDTAGIVAALVRVVVVVLFTAVETVALGAWLALVRDAPTISRMTAVGLGILAVALIVEHVLTGVAVDGFDLAFPGGKVVVISLTETVLWGLWLVIAERIGGVEGFAVAGVVLAALLVPQHTVEDNVLRGEGLLSDLVDLGTLGFSVVEAAGATVWLALVLRGDLFEPLLAEVGTLAPGLAIGSVDPAAVGVGILAVALFVEHNVGVRFSRRP